MIKNVVLLVIVLVIVGLFGWVLFKDRANSQTQAEQKTAVASATPDDGDINNDVLQTATDPKMGKYMTDPQGKALYTYDGDIDGKSNCNDSCAKTWTPYLAPAKSTQPLPKDVTTIKRLDGTSQYAYQGHALYHYSGDVAPHVINGNDVMHKWHIIQPHDRPVESAKPKPTERPLKTPRPEASLKPNSTSIPATGY